MRHKASILLTLLMLMPLLQPVAATTSETQAIAEGTPYPYPLVPSSVSRLILVRLWNITGHGSYMTKILEDQGVVIVYTGHGDASLDGSYVSSCGDAYVYDIMSGELLGMLDGPGTWRVLSWKPLRVERVLGYCGYFSADSNHFVVDFRVHGFGAAYVFDLLSINMYRIDLSSVDCDEVYAIQLDLDGDTVAVGCIRPGVVHVFKKNGTVYSPVWSSPVMGQYYGRRLQMTLDGSKIIVGGIYVNVIDVWVWDDASKTYRLEYRYYLPEGAGGAGALGITDPWNIGYIVVGTYNGWFIVLASTAYKERIGETFIEGTDLVALVEEKVAPDGCWFYNPFYDRYIPERTEIVYATSKCGVGVVYDLVRGDLFVLHYPEPSYGYYKAGGLSADGRYVFIGNALYMVVTRDQYDYNLNATSPLVPRLRLWGRIYDERTMFKLDNGIVYAPKELGEIMFYSVRVNVKRLVSTGVPVELVANNNLLGGRLAPAVIEGLVDGSVVATKYAEVLNLTVHPGTAFSDILAAEGFTSPDRAAILLATARYTPPPYFEEGWTSLALAIHVPLDRPMMPYSSVFLDAGLSVYVGTLYYDKDKRALAVLGIPLDIGKGAGITYAGTRLGATILSRYAQTHGVQIQPWTGAKILYRVAGAVGAAVALWGVIDAALVEWGGIGEVKPMGWIVIAPVFRGPGDTKYSAIQMFLPFEESNKVQDYYNLLKSYMQAELGVDDVGFRVTYIGQTWDEFKQRLRQGLNIQVDLADLVRTTIAAKYGYTLDDLELIEVAIIVIADTRVKETFWEWLFGLGGVYVDTIVFVAASHISVRAVTEKFETTDPDEIAKLLGYIMVNGIKEELKPGVSGAEAEVALIPPQYVARIEFGDTAAGYYADLEIELTAVINKPFQELDIPGYTAKVVYDFYAPMRLELIEFVDMPCEMKYAERRFYYSYETFVHNITGFMELQGKREDERSPTGYVYYYASTKNILLFDPANGGVLEQGETQEYVYLCVQPPDALVEVYLNGTSVTSTIARHATIVVKSVNAEQLVTVGVNIMLKYLEGFEEKTLAARIHKFNATVPVNGTVYRIYDIADLVDKAIQLSQQLGKPIFVEVTAYIIAAKYNYIRANDRATVVYYPPPTLPEQIPQGNYTVLVRVLEYNATSSTWVPSVGANVTIYYAENGTIYDSKVTNENGIAFFIVPGGTWVFEATKKDYTPAKLVTTIFNDTVIQLYLAPVPMPPPESREYVGVNATLKLYVYDPTNGQPIVNATVTVTGPVNATGETSSDGTIEFILPLGFYNITVDAPGRLNQTLSILLDRDMVLNIPLPPTELPPNYGTLVVLVTYFDDKPYVGAHVEVVNATTGELVVVAATNSRGNATFILPEGAYNVTVKVMEIGYNRSYTETQTIDVVAGDTTYLWFVVPWNSTSPAYWLNGTPYFWLTVSVTWANGLPFHGANVAVYSYPEMEPIESMVTNGTGMVHFLLEGFKVYMVRVDARNPYNASETMTLLLPVNLTDHRVLTIKLPWLPLEPGLAGQYLLIVYTYDATTGKAVPDVRVVVRRGDLVWAAVTNATGYAEVTLPLAGLYTVEAYHVNYTATSVDVHVYDNVTWVNIPLAPAAVPEELLPPLNGTYPPVIVNGTPHYWVSIQIVYRDGYPFHGAKVLLYDNATGELIAWGVTNGTGFVHFLVEANKTIDLRIQAVNPENESDVWFAERVFRVDQHYYLVFRLPWSSSYYSPEVAIKHARIVVTRALGYYHGNISHLVLVELWTNTPQTITLKVTMYGEEGPLASVEETVRLEEGLTQHLVWVPVNVSMGGWVYAVVNITEYEADTRLDNNVFTTDKVFLKPFVDIDVFVILVPVEQKIPHAILPGDIVKIAIGVKVPVKLHGLLVKWKVQEMDLERLVMREKRGGEENLTVTEPGIVWYNVTMKVPWTSKLVVVVEADHPWDDIGFNNAANITLRVDPDVELVEIKLPPTLVEGQAFTVTIRVRANVEPGMGIIWLTVIDNTTAEILLQKEIELEPNLTVTFDAVAPHNPPAFGPLREPAVVHVITARVAGYDMYMENNVATVQTTVTSTQWLAAVAAMAALIVVFLALAAAAARAARSTIDKLGKRFVRKA